LNRSTWGWLRPLTAVSLAAALSGCWLPGLAQLERSERGEQVSATERRQVEAWLSAGRLAAGERRSLRAYAKVRLQAEQGKARVREVIAAERPARLRVETLNFLGQAQSLLVADGDRSTLYDGGRLLESSFPGELLTRLGLDLTPAEAIDLLLATPRIPEGAPTAVWAAGAERIAEYRDRRVRLGSSGEIIGVEAFDGPDRVRWIVEFDEWSEVPGGRYPRQIRAYFPLTDLRAEFVIEEVELNLALELDLFRIRSRAE